MREQSTFERAAAPEYDKEHENVLLEAIARAVFEASKVSDANAIVVRTGETASALVTVLACVFAMSPSATRSPAAIRKTCDDIGRKVRRQIANAEQSAEMQDFVARMFRGTGTRGNA